MTGSVEEGTIYCVKQRECAHFAPEFRKRNIIAKPHGSKQYAAVWQEFSNDWEELSY